MADYDWGKYCCGQIIGHKDNCPDHPIKKLIEKRKQAMADYSMHSDRESEPRVNKARLATDAVAPTKPGEKPEKWNTEWDDAYNLGVKHGIERERQRLGEKVQKFLEEIDIEV